MSSEQPPPSGLAKRLLAAAQQDTSWLVRIGDEAERTWTTGQVVDAYNERLIDPSTYVWTDGMRSWQQLQAVDALVEALHAEAARDEAASRANDRELGSSRVSSAQKRNNGSGRHEDSAIFSLEMLVGDKRESNGAAAEDSGLIDLAALTEPLEQSKEGRSHGVAPTSNMLAGGLFHVHGAVSAPTVPPPDVAPAPADNRRVVVGLMAAVTLLLAMLVFQLVKSQGPTSASSADGAAPAPSDGVAATGATSAAAEPATAAGHAATDPSAQPSAEPTGSAKALATSAPPSQGKPISRRPPQPVQPHPAAPPPATSARPATKKCPCPEDDLICQMRCATNR